MQIPGDAAFGDAVGAPLRRPVARLRADWDRDGLFLNARSDLTPVLSEVTVERSLSGDLPDAVSLIEGYASAALTATLEGAWADALTAAAVLSPYREDSPLYQRPTLGVPVEADFGFAGTALVRQFTGQIRSLRPDSKSRRVALTALDPADRLRALVSLPVYGIYRRDLVRYGRSGVPWSTNSTWVIDYILRRNGVYHAPAARSDAILSVTQNGGLAAEIGFANDVPKNAWKGPYDGVSIWTIGPFGAWPVRASGTSPRRSRTRTTTAPSRFDCYPASGSVCRPGCTPGPGSRPVAAASTSRSSSPHRTCPAGP